MLAFAANSLIARIALSEIPSGQAFIDPASYTLIRLVSGGLVLGIFVGVKKNFSHKAFSGADILSAVFLFLYAAAFSFAYVNLNTGLGALILFTSVQLTMFGWAIFKKTPINIWEIFGAIIALGALAWLVSPGLTAPSPLAAFLMAMSGIAWGAYSIRGRSAVSPLSATAGNFLLTIPMAIILMRFTELNAYGMGLAIISGAVTSGLGYALWYYVLPKISTTNAAISQLSVPVLAGVAGSLFLAEEWTLRFSIASFLILGGIAIAIISKSNPSSAKR